MIAFKKVSFNQYFKDLKQWDETILEDQAKAYYESIVLPYRATQASAGYDFSLPMSITVAPNTSILVPTGIRLALERDLVCLLMPRSSLGMKYGMSLDNTIGVIDADYFEAENEGHIMARLTFKGIQTPLTLKAGERFMQGVIVQYHQTDDDGTIESRHGGFGSTGK